MPVSDPIEHDEAGEEFRLQIAPGAEAHLSYSALGGGVHDFQSTYVPPAHRGKRGACGLKKMAGVCPRLAGSGYWLSGVIPVQS